MRSSDLNPSFKFPNRLYSPTITTNVLRVLWVLLVCWSELGVYYWSLSTCRWPVHKELAGEALRAILISDTQIRLPSETTSLLSYICDFLTNKYTKKSWRVTSRLKPNAVLFLGDMLRDGKSVEDDTQFARLVQEFKKTFVLDDSSVAYYLPGNNDVGMGTGLFSSPTKDARTYYQEHFGPLNHVFSLKNFTFLALDAPNLVDEDYMRNAHSTSFNHWEPISGGAVEAVRNLAAEHHHPLVLLSHIPLYRPDSAPCGPLRERGTIVRGVGHGYQNKLGKETTAFLMKNLEPIAVFSGDNRDYCEYVHTGTSFGVAGSIPEITVKSFSPSPHIRRPGFQLVSIASPMDLAPTPDSQSLLNRPCLLPDSTVVSRGYVWWIIVTLCAVLVLKVQRRRKFRLTGYLGHSLESSPPGSGHTSPLLQDANNTTSPIWSPTASPKTPRAQKLSHFRTPVAPATPTLRASSRPMSPNDSQRLSPQLIPSMHDDEDFMFPNQYAVQRDVRHMNDEEWTSIGREDYLDLANGFSDNNPRENFSPSQFISAPGCIPAYNKGHRSWTVPWSKTFMLGGKRRRLFLRIPRLSVRWDGFLEVLEVLRDTDRRTLLRRRGIFASTLLECISVFWPAGVAWLVINCWMF